MTAVKGRRGGAREKSGPDHQDGELSAPINASTPIELLKLLMNDPKLRPSLRLKAAIAAARYENGPKVEGKKEKRQEAAQEVAEQGFASPLPPPRLRVVR